jgi:hypothetical protein
MNPPLQDTMRIIPESRRDCIASSRALDERRERLHHRGIAAGRIEMMRNLLFSIHILAVTGWIGVGFFELYLGRRFLAEKGNVLEAPLIRIIQEADRIVVVATILVFATGIAMTFLEGYGFFASPWLAAVEAIMAIVIIIVAFIAPTATRLNRAVSALPAGPGPVPDNISALYARLEPWHWVMPILAVCAPLLAIWRPGF